MWQHDQLTLTRAVLKIETRKKERKKEKKKKENKIKLKSTINNLDIYDYVIV